MNAGKVFLLFSLRVTRTRRGAVCRGSRGNGGDIVLILVVNEIFVVVSRHDDMGMELSKV